MTELIDAIGQESTRSAIPHIQEKLEYEKQEEKAQVDTETELLQRARSKAGLKWETDPYRRMLCNVMMTRIRETRWPKGYTFKALPAAEGVALAILDNATYMTYAHGFSLSHDVAYDLNACVVLVMQAENRVDKLEEWKKNKLPLS